MQEPLIAALAAAGLPSEQARSVVANWLLGPNEEIADADDMDRLMIAADAPPVVALWFRKEGDEDAVSLPVAIRAVLDPPTPEAHDGD